MVVSKLQFSSEGLCSNTAEDVIKRLFLNAHILYMHKVSTGVKLLFKWARKKAPTMQGSLGANFVQDNSLALPDLASETQEHLFQRYSNTGYWGSQEKVYFKTKSDQGKQNPSTPKRGEYYASFVVSAVLITSAFHSSRAEKWATGQS